MNKAFERALGEYERRRRIENELIGRLSPEEMLARHDEFLIPVGPETGMFLHDLVVAANAKYVVELGTSYG